MSPLLIYVQDVGSGSGAMGSTFVPTIPPLNDFEFAELGQPSFEYHPEFFLTAESGSPAVTGDVVQGWNSIGEGDNTSYGLSSTSGNRPTLREDSIGLPYLDFSGSKYFSQTAGVTQFASGKFTIVMVCSFNSVTADTFPFSMGLASGFAGYQQCRIDSTTSLLRNTLNDGTTSYTVGLGGISTVIPNDNKKCIIMLVHTTEKQYLYYAEQDGDVQEIDCGDGLGAGSSSADIFAVSARVLNGAYDAFANLNVYHIAGWAGKACYSPVPVMHTLGNAYRMNLGTSPTVRVPKPTHVWHFGHVPTTHIDIIGGADAVEDGAFDDADAEFSGEDDAITPGAGTYIETSSVFTSLGARENTSVTYAMRFRPTVLADHKLWATWQTGALDWVLDILATGELRYRRSDNAGVRTLQTPNSLDAGTWYVAVFGYDAPNTQMFMRVFGGSGDNFPEATTTDANLATPYAVGSQASCRFFKDDNGGVTFTGRIHWAAAWYGRKLTLDQQNELVTGRFFASNVSQSRPPFQRV